MEYLEEEEVREREEERERKREKEREVVESRSVSYGVGYRVSGLSQRKTTNNVMAPCEHFSL